MSPEAAKIKFAEHVSVFNDPLFKFDEEAHRYTYDGSTMLSATTFVGKFHEEFDAESMSATYAAKHGLVQEDVKAMWANEGDVARYNGKVIHKWIEDFFSEGVEPEIPEEKHINERIKEFQIFHEHKLADMLVPIAQELKVFHKGRLLSGTIDAIYWVPDPDELKIRLGCMEPERMDLFGNFVGKRAPGEYQIWDWKTNKVKNFTTDNDFAFKFLKYPFNRLKDNSLNKYSIQVSFYKNILREVAGLQMGDSYLCHIPPINNDKGITAYRAKDLTDDVLKQLGRDFSFQSSSNSLF